MYVYVAKFENQPCLIKIGISENVKTRITTLQNVHGKATLCDKYIVGDSYIKMESFLHKMCAANQVRVSGDGGTEFFKDCVYEEVTKILKVVQDSSFPAQDLSEYEKISNEISAIEKSIADRKEKIRRISYKTFVCRDYSKTEQHHYIHTADMPILQCFVRVHSSIELGFKRKKCLTKLVDYLKTVGYTTYNRVEFLYNLFEKDEVHTKMSRPLSKLINKRSAIGHRDFLRKNGGVTLSNLYSKMTDECKTVNFMEKDGSGWRTHLRDDIGETWETHAVVGELIKMIKQEEEGNNANNVL